MGVAMISFITFAAAQVATPGPANLALMATGARFGFKASLPFVAGVALGKQLIIWPIGYGLVTVATLAPALVVALQIAALAYIFWLAWRIANMRLDRGSAPQEAPGFFAGLWVHPLNPKAWAMVLAGFTTFVAQDTPVFYATLSISLALLACQLLFHPIWALAGERIAKTVAGSVNERYLMWFLAALTVVSVLFAVFEGGRR